MNDNRTQYQPSGTRTSKTSTQVPHRAARAGPASAARRPRWPPAPGRPASSAVEPSQHGGAAFGEFSVNVMMLHCSLRCRFGLAPVSPTCKRGTFSPADPSLALRANNSKEPGCTAPVCLRPLRGGRRIKSNIRRALAIRLPKCHLFVVAPLTSRQCHSPREYGDTPATSRQSLPVATSGGKRLIDPLRFGGLEALVHCPGLAKWFLEGRFIR